MTRIFTASGQQVPVTLIEAGPCTVVRCKSTSTDGYNAIAVGFGVAKHPSKPMAGQCKELKATPAFVQEFAVAEEHEFKAGQVLDVSTLSVGESIKVVGTSKGKGFAGVIKRHNFSRGPETHGSDHHRHPGSIGSMFPQHVRKGRRMAGHMGSERVTVRNLEVVDILPEKNILAVKGAVPGIRGALIRIESLS